MIFIEDNISQNHEAEENKSQGRITDEQKMSKKAECTKINENSRTEDTN